MTQIARKHWSIFVASFFVAMILATSSSAQTTRSSIEQMAGWASCDRCAGAGGAGPTASHYMHRGIRSPAMSSTSSEFHISGSRPYADALWWKQLGASNSATNLVYSLYFYIKTPQNSQALEFDANQANGSHRWIFGTQCNIAAGHWDIWANAAGKWTSTGIPCHRPAAYKWHHLTWEFKRSSTRVTFVAFTYDGVKHYVNRSYPARASGVRELNVAFQMDQRSNHVAYSTWLDAISLKYW
jgi:hypothetical protein